MTGATIQIPQPQGRCFWTRGKGYWGLVLFVLHRLSGRTDRCTAPPRLSARRVAVEKGIARMSADGVASALVRTLSLGVRTVRRLAGVQPSG
jgi:hypothetical protein